jgi:hypothetical protein
VLRAGAAGVAGAGTTGGGPAGVAEGGTVLAAAPGGSVPGGPGAVCEEVGEGAACGVAAGAGAATDGAATRVGGGGGAISEFCTAVRVVTPPSAARRYPAYKRGSISPRMRTRRAPTCLKGHVSPTDSREGRIRSTASCTVIDATVSCWPLTDGLFQQFSQHRKAKPAHLCTTQQYLTKGS